MRKDYEKIKKDQQTMLDKLLANTGGVNEAIDIVYNDKEEELRSSSNLFLQGVHKW